MSPSRPAYRLRTLFGVTTLAVFACAVAAMMYSTPPSRVGWSIFLPGVVLGFVVGFRRHGKKVERVAVAIAFMFGALLLAAYLSLVAIVADRKSVV